MLKSKICDLLGIEYPVLQGGMAWVADAALAAAVSNAGGLGIVAAMNRNGEQLREEIAKVRALTDKPFAENFRLRSSIQKKQKYKKGEKRCINYFVILIASFGIRR